MNTRLSLPVFLLLVGLSTPAFAQTQKPRTIPDSVIGRVLYDARFGANKCYLAHVPVSQRGQGDNARITLRIDYEGRVASAYLEDTTVQEAPARECLLALSKRLRFDAQASEFTTVTVWFGLDSKVEDTVVRPMNPPSKAVTSKDIVATASQHMAEFTACYSKDGADRSGQVTLALIVGSTGAVQEARIDKNTFPDTRVADCIVGIARKLTFDAPGDDAPVIATIPFRFKTK